MALNKYDEYDYWLAALMFELDQKGVNISEVARKAGIGRTQLYNLRSGKKVKPPKASVLQNIPRALGFLYDDFIERGRQLVAGSDNPREFEACVSIKRQAFGLDENGDLVVRATPNNVAPIGKYYLQAAEVDENELVVFLVQDNAMAPHINKGTAVMVRLGDAKIRSGAVYLIRLGAELAIRYVENTPSGIRVKACAPNISPVELVGEEVKTLRIYGRAVTQQGLIS